jgi:anti-sigma factor RsiW
VAAAPVADDAILAYRTFAVEVVHPVEVAADQETHLVQWLSRRLGRKLTAPKLDALGLKLIGGRLLPAPGAPAAQFMYEDTQGKRVAVYVRPGGAGEPTSFRFERKNDVAAFSWIDAKLSYAVVAETDRERLLGVARAIYEQYEAL